MTDFYKAEFSLEVCDGTSVDFLEEIISAIRKWLKGKYGTVTVGRIIFNWEKFRLGGVFEDSKQMGKFRAETRNIVSTNDISRFSWMCTITEHPPCNSRYVPRKWITRIGYWQISENSAGIYYSVSYKDLPEHSGESLPRPAQNTPKVAQFIQVSKKWVCKTKYVSVDFDLNSLFESDVFLKTTSDENLESNSLNQKIEGEFTMVDREVSITSLCCVEENPRGGVWLHRIADVENDELQLPYKSDRDDKYFENREWLFSNDGPTLEGTVGIWNWSATPNRENPLVDYIQSHYVENISPIRVVILLNAKSEKDVIEQLQSGKLRVYPYYCDTLFCYSFYYKRQMLLSGVLCKADEFKIDDRYIALNNDVYSLPVYEIYRSDVISVIRDKVNFFKYLQLDAPTGYVSVGDVSGFIKSLILERTTWPVFKETIGATKADWRNCKLLLEKVCNQSLVQTIEEKLNCTHDQAEKYVNEFIERSDQMISVGDIDADILSEIVLHNEELKQQCEADISQRWQETHREEIAKAEAEVEKIRNRFSQEKEATEQKFLELNKQVSSAREEWDALQKEIDAAQKKLGQMITEIDQYEVLGQNTVEAVRTKIADAQKDMAGFIADLSVFLPQSSGTVTIEKSSAWEYKNASADLYSEDDVELAANWRDEIDFISQNLFDVLGADGEFGEMLTAFLYAAHVHKIPVLVAGPGGQEVAEVFSASVFGCSAGRLILGSEWDPCLADEISRQDASVLSVQNMFGKCWSDTLPQEFAKMDKQIVWSHPYVEDLSIEPKGLYNYMLPVFSECFVDSISADKPWPGKREADFEVYTPTEKKRLQIAAFKRLGLSRMQMHQLETVLTDVKAMMNKPAQDKDVEILLGLLPFAVLTGKQNVLKEVLESESGISRAVKAELARYVEEE